MYNYNEWNDDYQPESFARQIRQNPHQRKQADKAQKFATQVRSAVSGEIRHKNVEPDPAMLEKFDSFYHTTKSLLVLFQIMGVMPIERVGLGKTTYR